jgi:sulfonate transport system permease protein
LMLAWLFWIAVVGYAVNALALGLQRRVARAMGTLP